MKRILAVFMSFVIAFGLVPAQAFALVAGEFSAGTVADSTAGDASSAAASASLVTQAAPSIPAANPGAVSGASAPSDEATREKVYVKDYYSRDYAHYYGPADGVHTDDGTVIEAALKDSGGKTLVLERDKTYTFGSYVRSNEGGNRWRLQGIRTTTDDVVIEGNGATIEWDSNQAFVGGEGLYLEGTKDDPVRDIVIRNLNFKAVNCSRTFNDDITGEVYAHHNLVQLKGMYCENILVENCTFEALPHPDEAKHALSDKEGRGVSNIWFYGGAKDITVRNCTLRDVTCGSQESGSNLLFSGDCDWYKNVSADFKAAYATMTPDEQYRAICERHLKGSVENILVEHNTFEHACHDESISLWRAEVFKDVLIADNDFNVHDSDAHVPSTMNFTFGEYGDHDRLDNVVFTRNHVYGEATRALMNARADAGGDLHIVDNDLHFKRIKLDRERNPQTYVYSSREDVASTNGVMDGVLNRDYVDFSGNRVTYDNDGGLGLDYLMGQKNLYCADNTFIANGPLKYLACLYAADMEGAAGHETVYACNRFELNGLLKSNGALIRGCSRFTDNVVHLNGEVSASALFQFSGNTYDKTEGGITTKANALYVLPDGASISGNKVFANTALPKGMAALSVYDASFAGHTLDFTGNKLWNTVAQVEATWPLVRVVDVQGQAPVVDATGTSSNLFDVLSFYRSRDTDPGHAAYGAALVDPTVRFAGQRFTATHDHQTTHSLSDRVYDTRATGAPRAAGRTAATVKALVDSAVEATSGYEFGQFANPIEGAEVPAIVHVGQFGAYGDGVHDDRAALQAAFDSGASTVLFERDAAYKVCGALHLRHGDVTILGNGATIFTGADYSDDDERLFSIHGVLPSAVLRDAIAEDWRNRSDSFIENVGVYQLNLASHAFDPTAAPADRKVYDPTTKNAYRQQLMVQMAHNVDVFGCTFTIERPTGGRVVDGCTALDAYTGWHDLTVENCTVIDECDGEGGGGMWIRDHFNMGASNIVFKGNSLFKRCHDEVLAVFNTSNVQADAKRPITDVLIADNEFTMDEGDASPSVMAFTVTCAHDVLVENNRMNVKTTGGLLWSNDSSGVVVRDNYIMQTRSHVGDDAKTNFLLFRDDVALVESNRITLNALDESAGRNDVYAFKMSGAVRDNVVVSDLPLDYVASGARAVKDNEMTLNAPVHVVFNDNRAVTGNEVVLNAHADQYVQYFRSAFEGDVLISRNTFDNRVSGDSHTVLNVNEAVMGGHAVRFTGNTVTNASLGSGARLLFLKPADEAPQSDCVVISGNDIPDLAQYGVYCPNSQHTYVWPKAADELHAGESNPPDSPDQPNPPDSPDTPDSSKQPGSPDPSDPSDPPDQPGSSDALDPPDTSDPSGSEASAELPGGESGTGDSSESSDSSSGDKSGGTAEGSGGGSSSESDASGNTSSGGSNGKGTSGGKTNGASSSGYASVPAPVRPVIRLASPKTEQRRYTTSVKMVRNLSHSRWRPEGVAFYVVATGGKKVYELKRAGRYVYTTKSSEVAKFKRAGWKSKKTVFRALASGGVKVYRLRNKATGAYLLTKKASEVKSLKKRGWKSQGAVFRVAR